MEMEMQTRKRWRVGNCREDGHIDDDEDDGDIEGVEKDEKGRILGWRSSRIIRVSRASGGKDRHSKVLTAKGPRDRRVRLSVSTAIQFYDLQDRLGVDQPSKAVEWLIKAAAHAIAKLPSLDADFATSPKQSSDEKQLENDELQQQQQQPVPPLSLAKSASSTTSETSKGSGLSLSRSEIRVKARERARERTAKEKEKDPNLLQQQNLDPNSQSSFSDLLAGGNDSASATNIPPPPVQVSNPNFTPKYFRHVHSADYFVPAKSQQHSSVFCTQSLLGNPNLSSFPANISAGDHQELQHYAFLHDHIAPMAANASATNDQQLNFSISSSLGGFNRGTLQSNSPSSFLPHLQRFPTSVENPLNVPLFFGTAPSTASLDSQFPASFDGRLQLFYGDGCRRAELKGKGKS